MNENILLLILLALIIITSKSIVKMMNENYEKYRILIYYGRILLGFLIAMLLYIVYLMLKGEDIMSKIFG
ncbi:MAG: hypothetical protein JXC36_06965 [Candidatus Atribacteria bacterium]|nr:hypothetical protein [Candidatus Atribacteria bacterium]